MDWTPIDKKISEATGKPFKSLRQQSVSGGCINRAFTLKGQSNSFFVKLNHADRLDMFEAEAQGLKEIVQSNTIKAPAPVATGIAENTAFIVMEFIPMGSCGNENWKTMGAQLAAMHKISHDKFGWSRENTIGATPQINTPCREWIPFYRDQRLKYQFHLAQKNGRTFEGENALHSRIPSFFESYEPIPSLLHGDLWSGNASFDTKGNPVIYDPATYYGDRETDIAFTYLFGAFPRPFYDSYNVAFPLDKGFEQRKNLYNLYHILNHFNLFGGGYASQAQSIIDQLLA